MFWIACPAAPFTRLSTAHRRRPPCRYAGRRPPAARSRSCRACAWSRPCRRAPAPARTRARNRRPSSASVSASVVHSLGERGVARGEHAAHRRHEVRHEQHGRRDPGRELEPPFDLRRVLVARHPIGPEAFLGRGVRRRLARRPACARQARLPVDADRARLDQVRAQQRRETQDRGGRVAARGSRRAPRRRPARRTAPAGRRSPSRAAPVLGARSRTSLGRPRPASRKSPARSITRKPASSSAGTSVELVPFGSAQKAISAASAILPASISARP